MHFRFSTAVALLSAPFCVLADNPNGFKIPQGGLSCTAGQPCDLKWQPSTQGTVSLVLRSGASNNLEKGVTIASHIANDGDFTWLPASNLPRGSDYTIEIIDDADPTQTNYTPYFVLDSSNVLPSTTATSGSVSGTTTATVTQTSGSTSVVTAKTTITSGSTTAMTSGSSTGTANTGTGGTQTGASFQPTSTSATGASSSQGSAARATAVAGMLGVVALGAFAL